MLRTASIIAFAFSRAARRLPVPPLAQVHLGQHRALRLKAQRSVQHAHHAAYRDQRGRDQQHADRNLRAQQEVPQRQTGAGALAPPLRSSSPATDCSATPAAPESSRRAARSQGQGQSRPDRHAHRHACRQWPYGDCHRFSAPSSRPAVTSPAAPPSIDTTIASVISCRTSRHRLAPRATRSASSRLRSAARAAKRAGQIRARRHQHEQSQPGHAVKKSANDVTVVRDRVLDGPAAAAVRCRSPDTPSPAEPRSHSDCPLPARGVTPGFSRPSTVTVSMPALSMRSLPCPSSRWVSSSPATQTAPCRGTAPVPRPPP